MQFCGKKYAIATMIIKHTHILILTAFMLSGGHAQARIYTQQESKAMLEKITTNPPEMLLDVMRKYNLVAKQITVGDADDFDVENGYKRGDILISIFFDQEETSALPCDFKTRSGGGIADFIKRGKAYIPDSELSKWMRSGQCPPVHQ
ncbi:MAG: hypothetical protein ACXWAT_09650 [Methylobacter sp.]